MQPYRSQKIVFHFYFPKAGQFKHFPSNVSVNGVVTARGGANDINVVDSLKLTKIDSFLDIIHAGTKDDVLNFLKTETLHWNNKEFEFEYMLFMLKDKDFFKKVVEILEARLIYEPSVW